MKNILIKSIKVEKLFGKYTYLLPEKGSFCDAAILYGDNGVGKTTLLKVIFHLLSSANDKGHRTALYKCVFKKIELTLASGVVLTAEKTTDDYLLLEIFKRKKKLVSWRYRPQSDNKEDDYQMFLDMMAKETKLKKDSGFDNIPRGNKAYINELSMCAPKVYFLSAERFLDTDSNSASIFDIDFKRFIQAEEIKDVKSIIPRSKEIALTHALMSASRWISSKAIQGTNKGTSEVHLTYATILQHLSGSEIDVEIDVQTESMQLLKRFDAIEKKMVDHAKYELASELPVKEFRKALTIRDIKKRKLAITLLEPYMKSLEKRIMAIEPVYQLIDNFIITLNGYVYDKEISFTMSKGFQIIDPKNNKVILISQLSSGEQQLLLLFCNALIARDVPSVFIIDEPEISLNVKWQRNLVGSLLEITKDAEIQFIFASHSIELLAKYRHAVVRMVCGGH